METKITIAVITSLTSFLTAIFITLKSFSQSRKIEKLKNELELKKNQYYDIFKYSLSYNTELANQYFIHLKDFLQLTQILKDKTRDLIKYLNNFSPKEKQKKIKEMKDEIIVQYSKSVYFFNNSDKNKFAHSIKNLFIKIFDLLETDKVISEDIIKKTINEISELQNKLQKEVDLETERILSKITDV